MKLLHVASSYPLQPGDSTAPFMEEMLSPLADRGHDVAIVLPRVKGLQEGPRNGVSVVGAPYAPPFAQTWGYGRSLNSRNNLRLAAAAVTPLALTSLAVRVRSQANEMLPDVVHLHWVVPLGALSLTTPRDTPVVVSVHGADVRFATGPLRGLTRTIVNRADTLVAASSGVLNDLSSSFPEVADKSRVIPHGASAELFQETSKDQARASLHLNRAETLILGVGRLVPKKGFDSLIRAMSRPELSHAKLVLAGVGPDAARLESLIGQHAPGRARLLGEQSRHQVATWLAASDVVVIPSIPNGRDVDSGPVVLMEAMASGRPVVATRIGMAPDVIASGTNGYLLDNPDPRAIAGTVTAALENRDRLGRAAASTFKSWGDWSRVARDLESLYEELVR